MTIVIVETEIRIYIKPIKFNLFILLSACNIALDCRSGTKVSKTSFRSRCSKSKNGNSGVRMDQTKCGICIRDHITIEMIPVHEQKNYFSEKKSEEKNSYLAYF